MNKKIIFFLMVFATLISLKKVNAKNIITDNGLEITEEEINKLKNLGFTEEQIYTMEEKIFNENKELDGEIVAQTTKFYKTTIIYNTTSNINNYSNGNNISVIDEVITEDEYNSLPNNSISSGNNSTFSNLGITETDGKKMVTTIIRVNDKYRLKVDLVWKNMPKVRSNDILSIGMDPTVSGIPDSRYFQQTWIYENPCQNSSQRGTSSSGSWKINQRYYGIAFELPKNKSCTIPSSDPLITPTVKTMNLTSLSSYMYYDINKLTSPINTINAYGDYAHAVKSIDISASISFGFNLDLTSANIGISFTPSIKPSYDNMEVAQAYLDGIIW